MSVRLKSLVFRQVHIPLKRAITHALHTRTDTDSILVEAHFNDGSIGFGEGLPRHYVTGESVNDAWQICRDFTATAALAEAWTTPADAVDRLSELTLPATQADARQCFGNSVRCAIELAVLDGLGRVWQQPLSSFAGSVAAAEPILAYAARVRYGAAFTAMSLRRQIVQAAKLRYYQFADAKIKLGIARVNDRALLRRLRWFLGTRFDLRGDANEAWTLESLPGQMDMLARYKLTSIEQPVPHAAIGGLRQFRGQWPVAIMLDESLASQRDAEAAIANKTCDLFNLRLSKCGGFLPAVRLAATAHAAGLGYQLGCQVGETGILSAAGRHFATAIAGIRYHEGSFDRFLVAEPLTKEDLTFGRAGWAKSLIGPGLGVTVDPIAVGRVTTRQTELVFH